MGKSIFLQFDDECVYVIGILSILLDVEWVCAYGRDGCLVVLSRRLRVDDRAERLREHDAWCLLMFSRQGCVIY